MGVRLRQGGAIAQPGEINLVLSLTISLAGGLLMGLTPAPLHLWPLAWIALVPLWLGVKQSVLNGIEHQGRGWRRGWRSASLQGLAWGIGYHGLALSWITGIHPMTWLGVSWWASVAIALFCWVFITLWGAALVALWASLLTLVGMATRWNWPKQGQKQGQGSKVTLAHYWRLGVPVLTGVALWCGLEWLWSRTPLWWTALALTQSPGNGLILHLGQLSGPASVAALLVAVNGCLAEALSGTFQGACRGTFQQTGKVWGAGLGAIALFLGGHGVGGILYSQPLQDSPTSALTIGIIQGNIPNEIKLYRNGLQQALERYTQGHEELVRQGVDAVLTPETALPFQWSDELEKTNSFARSMGQSGVVTWLGTFVPTETSQGSVPSAKSQQQPRKTFTNSLLTFTGEGQRYSRYDKVNLVPLGEYIPFEALLGRLIDRLSPLDAHLVKGNPDAVFDTPLGRAIASICYDSAFSESIRRQAAAGGEFILSASNDAHYSAAMPAQHHAQDVLRAIETDRWAARATNTGYSAFVTPHGQTLWRSELNTTVLYQGHLYRRTTLTLYVRWGDWLTPTLMLLTPVVVFLDAYGGWGKPNRKELPFSSSETSSEP